MSMSVVLSFVVLTTGGPNDPELHWSRNNVPYRFNTDGSDNLGGDVFPAMDQGFQVWNEASGVGYDYGGDTSLGSSSVVDGAGNAEADGNSIVTWIENGWPYGPGTIAITWTYFFADGEIDEADMLMNGDDYFWTTSSAGADTDVQSITAHEAGHYLGLGHSSVETATMFATVNQGETSKRSLDPDDIAGAQHIYSGGGGGGDGCACTLDGTGAPRAGFFAGVLSVLAVAMFGMFRMRQMPVRLASLAQGSRRVPARGIAVAVAALALFAAKDASATVMIDQSLEQLAAESESIVHGDVTSVETLTDGRVIWTVQRMKVRETLAGLSAGDTVEIVTPGGTLPAGVRTARGHQGAKAVGIPEFSVGQEVVVFLTRTGGDFLTVTALQQGLFAVRRDGKGVATALRDVTGVHRMERTEAGLKAVGGDELSGLPLDGLVSRIRSLSTRVSPGR